MEKIALTDAVKELRVALGDTQQTFAFRTGTAIRTVARWETVRPPHGSALGALYRMARDAGQKGLAELFWKAIHDEIGLGHDAGLKINDACVGVSQALGRLRLLEVDNLTAAQRKQIENIEKRLATVEATLNSLDPFSISIEGGKSK